MKPLQQLFFAAPQDMLDWFLGVERGHALEYLRLVTPSEDGEFPRWSSAASIKGLGLTDASSSIVGPRFLIGFEGVRWRSRKVKQREGGYHYFVDQATNPDTVYLLTGGLHPQKALLAGTLCTTATTESAKALYSMLNMSSDPWLRLGKYLVGPDAQRLSRDGYRLVPHSVAHPPEDDLHLAST